MGQKWRLSVESFQLRVSSEIDTWLDSHTAKKLPSDPVSFRQTWQWQRPTRTGLPLTSNFSYPFASAWKFYR